MIRLAGNPITTYTYEFYKNVEQTINTNLTHNLGTLYIDWICRQQSDGRHISPFYQYPTNAGIVISSIDVNTVNFIFYDTIYGGANYTLKLYKVVS